MRAGLVAGAAVVVGFIAHTVVSARTLDSGKEALLAKQRAVSATLGAEWFPLRDRIEADILAAAKPYAGDRIEPQAQGGAFRSQAGLYLRMRWADAVDAGRIQAVAASAKRDAFAACLLREPLASLDGGAIAEQPWNLGRAYTATRILTPTWSQAVAGVDDDLRLRVFVEQFDKAVREEIPVAIDVVKRAKFLLLVLDEDGAVAPSDAGAMTEETLQLALHPSRVHVFSLSDNQEIVRLRRSAEALVVPAGERQATDPETHDAMQRQANNCALAAEVQAALESKQRP